MKPLSSTLLILSAALFVSSAFSQDMLPATIALPAGFQPEGIAAGPEDTIYAGSVANGAIWQGDVASGEGRIIVPGEAGRAALGLAFDDRTSFLYAAGGMTGNASVFDTTSETLLAVIPLTSGGTFVNDAVVDGNTVWFTDSNRAVLYRLALDDDGGLPEGDGTVSELELGGDYTLDEGAFNANGIVAAADGTLIIVNSGSGQLFAVDPATGNAKLIDLGGADVKNGDGLLLAENTLYVVQNMDNQISVVQLADDLSSGEISGTITSPDFDIPTTAAEIDGALYVVNARFTTQPTADTAYDIVRIEP
jgi:sugar lactone lactonase YvrE